jgi:integrase
VFRIKDAKNAIAGACKRLGSPAYSHRSFRRMFVTRAIELGIDVKVIAEWQGHRDGESSFWTRTPTLTAPIRNAWRN